MQGVPLAQLTVDDFTVPITAYTRTHFLTARGAGGGTWWPAGRACSCTVSTPGSGLAMPGILASAPPAW